MIPKCKELINNTVIVSPTEPTGIDRKKVWLQKGKNLLNSFLFNTETKGGITLTKNTNGSIKLNGTAAVPLAFDVSVYISMNTATSYVLSKNKVDAGAVYALILRDSNNNEIVSLDSSLSYKAFTPSSDVYYIRIFIPQGVTLDTTIYPQLEQGSEATAYEPYIEDKTYILNDNDVYEEYKSFNEINNSIKDINNSISSLTTEIGKAFQYKGEIFKNVNWNNLATGVYKVNTWTGTGGSNYPAENLTGFLYTITFNNNNAYQVCFTQAHIYTRYLSNTWTSWVKYNPVS